MGNVLSFQDKGAPPARMSASTAERPSSEEDEVCLRLISAPPSSSRTDPTCSQYCSCVAAHWLRQESRLAPPSAPAGGAALLGRTAALELLAFLYDALQLRSETLHLAVSLFDRVLAASPYHPESPSSSSPSYEHLVSLNRLAVVCALLACKYEEVYRVRPIDCLALVPHGLLGGLSLTGLAEVERVVLTSLGWRLAEPTAWHFLRRMLYATRPLAELLPQRTRFLAELILDLGLGAPACVPLKKSVLAAAAVLVAVHVESRGVPVPAEVADAVMDARGGRWEPDELAQCVLALQSAHGSSGIAAEVPHTFASLISRKYGTTRRFAVASLPGCTSPLSIQSAAPAAITPATAPRPAPRPAMRRRQPSGRGPGRGAVDGRYVILRVPRQQGREAMALGARWDSEVGAYVSRVGEVHHELLCARFPNRGGAR